MFGGPPNNSKNNSIKLFFFKEKRFRANHYCSMSCLHNHDQLLEFLRKIFLKGFQIYQNYLCALRFIFLFLLCTFYYLYFHFFMHLWLRTKEIIYGGGGGVHVSLGGYIIHVNKKKNIKSVSISPPKA